MSAFGGQFIEESGFLVKATRPLAVFDRRLHHVPAYPFALYKMYFRCQLLSDTPVESPQGDLESSEWRFFAEADIPPEAEISTGRVRREQLIRLMNMADDEPTLFD